jgi:hypothetical protein
LSVRTKASELGQAQDQTGRPGAEQYVLEAQLENLTDGIISIGELAFESQPPFHSTSLNWDYDHLERPTLTPREVTQVAFLVKEQSDPDSPDVKKEITRDGRTILGVLTIHWRSDMGQAGVLSTGWLTTRKR